MRPSYLLRELVRRDLASRYRGSVLGFLWAFLTPLWQLALYTLVFSIILRVPLDAEGTKSFPIFLFAGLIPWLGFSEGLIRSTTAVVEHSNLVRKHRFPSEVLVVSAVVSALLHQAAAILLFTAYQLFWGDHAGMNLLWLVPGLALLLVLALGLGWAAAAVQVYFRDVVQIVGIALSGGFYLTPIVYPASLVPEILRPWLPFNPISTVVVSFRAALIGSPPPEARAWLIAVVLAVAIALTGLLLFRRLRAGFADEL
jgi:lipopolysaccharide transport system permease protein